MADAVPSQQYRVGMTCGGCASAVQRVLGRVAGVAGIDTDVEGKLVTVRGTADPAVVLAALKKWGDAAGKTVEAIA